MVLLRLVVQSSASVFFEVVFGLTINSNVEDIRLYMSGAGRKHFQALPGAHHPGDNG